MPLTLTRKVDETIVIELADLIAVAKEAAGPHGDIVEAAMVLALGHVDTIEVTPIELFPQRARLSFDAPGLLRIYRKELCQNGNIFRRKQ